MKHIKTLLIASLLTTSLLANQSEAIDLKLKNYEDINVLKKIDNILISVKEEGLVRDLVIDSKKWEDVNFLLRDLIKRRNYTDAYILFKHIDFDQKIEEYKSYLTFFQIMNKIESRHTDFKNIQNIHDNFLLTHLFANLFLSIEKELINDVTILSKIKLGLIDIENKYLSGSEKQRIRYKIELLRGDYVKALSIIETIDKLTKEDIKYKSNTKQILKFMQENFFKNYLKISHTEFKNYNLLYRTNQKTCNK